MQYENAIKNQNRTLEDIEKGVILPKYQMAYNYDLIIVGAGLAGITAAHHLINNDPNLSILILEGADYIGGRIRTIPWSNDINLNIGAHWVAGNSSLNPLNMLLEKTYSKRQSKLTNFDLGDLLIINMDGSIASYDWTPIKQTFEILKNIHKTNRKNVSIATAIAAIGWSPITDMDRIALWFFCDYEWGLSPQNTPLYNTVPAPYSVTFGSEDQLLIATDGGSPDIFASLIRELPPDCIRLNECVNSISNIPNSRLLTISSTSNKYIAKTVIVTASLNVIKSGAITFIPPLPEDKTRVLNSYNYMAQYEVVLVEFNTRFWATHLSDGKTCMLYTGTPHMLIHDLSSYYDNLPILEFHLVGNDAVRISTQSPEQTQIELMAIIRRIFGAYISDPIRLHSTCWNSNPMTLGAFSVRPLDMTDEEHIIIRKPCMDKRLFFAGDGLHDMHCGYMHAAYLSGIDTANEILKFNNSST